MTSLAAALADFDRDRLTRLLERRPDLAGAPAPRNLAELARLSEHPDVLARALRTFSTPLLEVTEALVALGQSASVDALGRLLAGDGPDHDTAVAAVLNELYDVAVAWPGAGDRIHIAAGLYEARPTSLRLGPPLRLLLPVLPVETMKRVLAALGYRSHATLRAGLEAELAERLSDPDTVRDVLSSAPRTTQEYLNSIAIPEPPDEDDDYVEDDEYTEDDELDFSAYTVRREAQEWAIAHGFLIWSTYGYAAAMPAEVGLALRGPDYRAPFRPFPPPVRTADLGADVVEAAAAGAIAEFAQQSGAVLDLIALRALPLVKSGGVAVRELTRLAKTAMVDEISVRLTVELAYAAGLLALSGGVLRVSENFSTWRTAQPSWRYGVLVRTWMSMDLTPTEFVDFDGRPVRALARRGNRDGSAVARQQLLDALLAHDPGLGADQADVVAAIAWAHPQIPVLPQDFDAPLATVWREAELLGVVARGALSEVGRALCAGDDDALVARASAVLPASATRARFGSDLTVLVVGSPSAHITAVLDAAADRESHGAGTTWRFSPASVRRALDDGVRATELEADLTAIAEDGLPQPLRYLIADVARRHGTLRLSPSQTIVRSDDTALLAEVAADRTLRKLGLRLVAPIALTADLPLADALAALRKAGYFPMPEDDLDDLAPTEAPARPETDQNRREAIAAIRRASAPPRTSPRQLSAQELAQMLLDAPDELPAPATDTERSLAEEARTLDAEELRQLGHAIDTGDPVVIVYESAGGAKTRRVISDAQFSGGALVAWCHLRAAERFFTVSRILAVAPAE